MADINDIDPDTDWIYCCRGFTDEKCGMLQCTMHLDNQNKARCVVTGLNVERDVALLSGIDFDDVTMFSRLRFPRAGGD